MVLKVWIARKFLLNGLVIYLRIVYESMGNLMLCEAPTKWGIWL